jgi:hypothetical protein
MPLLSTLHAIAPAADPSAPGWQAWVQAGAALLAVAVAVAWLTARWLIRRRAGCTGAADTRPGPCGKPPSGVRPAGLQVLQGPTNLPRAGDV